MPFEVTVVHRAHEPDPLGARPSVCHSDRWWTHPLAAAGRVFGLDLVLLHAPSAWDFREEVIVAGPLADVGVGRSSSRSAPQLTGTTWRAGAGR